jgi:hypothetical protein
MIISFVLLSCNTQGFNLTEESEAFELCDPDEKRALFRCGHIDKLAFAASLKKSDSMTNLKDEVLPKKPRPRLHSAGAKTFWGKPIDFQVSWLLCVTV